MKFGAVVLVLVAMVLRYLFYQHYFLHILQHSVGTKPKQIRASRNFSAIFVGCVPVYGLLACALAVVGKGRYLFSVHIQYGYVYIYSLR